MRRTADKASKIWNSFTNKLAIFASRDGKELVWEATWWDEAVSEGCSLMETCGVSRDR